MGNIIRVSRAFARFVGKYAYSAPNIAAHRLTACDDKAFLLFENLDQSTWSGRLSESRENYSRRRQRLLQGLEHPEEIESTTDPLADDEESPWIVLRQDEGLRAEILQDVERCMPENAYFREPQSQKMLLDILFIFCKLNADVGYRQGMHELLAPILWVVERDAIEPESAKDDHETNSNDELLVATLDASYIEHDSYTLFSLIMRTAKSFYELGDQEQAAEVLTTDPAPNEQPPRKSPIIEQSRRIHEAYLAAVDPGLAVRLKEVEVLPQVFLIRWIRLLFGREFPFDDLLDLWDTLFAADPKLHLVDYICVAMLLRVRWQLMQADYSTALTLLLRYPSPEPPNGPSSFVQDALYLRNNNSRQGGSDIIIKYSGKDPLLAGYGVDRPITTLPNAGARESHARTKSPLDSPARFIQQQGGIEGLLQNAAKGVLNRSERWGVNKAVREAVGEVKKNLQAAGGSPRRSADGSRWSLDEGRLVHGRATDDRATLHMMEERNQALARMLSDAIDQFWAQHTDKAEDEAARSKATEAFNIAVAKVQFVQVYLEDSTLTLPTEMTTTPTAEVKRAITGSPATQQPFSPAASPAPSRDDTRSETGHTGSTSKTVGTPSTSVPNPVSPTPSTSDIGRFHQPRSSLAQSSFAWMLGEDEGRSGFAAPSGGSSLSSDSRPGKVGSRPGFLFGDEAGDGSTGVGDGGQAEEGFNLGSLKRGKGRAQCP